jgi:hypothetical protein
MNINNELLKLIMYLLILIIHIENLFCHFGFPQIYVFASKFVRRFGRYSYFYNTRF